MIEKPCYYGQYDSLAMRRAFIFFLVADSIADVELKSARLPSIVFRTVKQHDELLFREQVPTQELLKQTSQRTSSDSVFEDLAQTV